MGKGETSDQSDCENALLSKDILSRGQIVHLGLMHPQWSGVSYVVPMNYAYDPKQHCLFMHAGAGKGQQKSLKRTAFKNAATTGANICFQVETDVRVLPMAGGTPCLSTTRYCSVLGYGTVELITDGEGKVEGLKCLFRQNTGLPAECCPDLPEKYLREVVVIKLTITEVTARKHGYSC